MPNAAETRPANFAHGSLHLPGVEIVSYNLELRDEAGFIGDRASGRAFRALLDESRARIREVTEDPLGDEPSRDLSKRKLDEILAKGDPVAAGIIHGAIEEFAQNLAGVARRFLRLKAWRDVTQIVIGGGLRQSRIGELAIGRAAVILKSEHIEIDLVPLPHHPDEAGLLGAAQLVPSWLFEGFDSLLAVDVGGSNIRCGVVRLKGDEAPTVWQFELWRHGEEKPKPKRDEAIDRLVEMLSGLLDKAQKKGFKVAPFVGIGCPGVIAGDGAIERGAQNLPGNWESSRFNLPEAVRSRLPEIGDHDTVVVLHNDAVVQGLSALPTMAEVPQWGVLTIGTGLGNACFSTKKA